MLARNESAKGEFSFNAAFFFYERMSHSFTLSCLENDQSKLVTTYFYVSNSYDTILLFRSLFFILILYFKYLWIKDSNKSI